eukprot:403371488
MCIVFFKIKPLKGIRFVALFNRDEQPERKRSHLDIHFKPSNIACAVDLEANGTWLGFNINTGNFGFLTNYENKEFHFIQDQRYRKGNLLMNFIRSDYIFRHPQEYLVYLDLFLKEGYQFNGTNIWLGNALHDDMKMVFAHNHETYVDQFSVIQSDDEDSIKEDLTKQNFKIIDSNETIAYGNGRLTDDFFKQKLGKCLMEGVYNLHQDFDSSHMKDVRSLVNHLFRLAEINKIPEDKERWVQIDLYDDHERKHNSSIFLEPHEEILQNDQKAIFATCSSTVMIITDDQMLHLFERVYDHSNQRSTPHYDKDIIENLIKMDQFDFLDHDSFTQSAYIESYISRKF